MATLPTVGASEDTWGNEVNAYLEVEHDADGTHGAITPTSITTGSFSTTVITTETLAATGAVSTGALTSTSSSTGASTSSSVSTVNVTASGAVAVTGAVTSGSVSTGASVSTSVTTGAIVSTGLTVNGTATSDDSSTGASTSTSVSTGAITATGAVDLGAATLEIPNSTDVSANTGEGLLSWESDRDLLFIGDGAAVQQLTRYADRGDPVNADFTLGDLTTDGTFQDLDLSSIVPAGAVAVDLTVFVSDNAPNSFILFRKKGNSNISAVKTVRTQSALAGNDGGFTVACDSNRVIQYVTTNTTFSIISITVTGWFL